MRRTLRAAAGLAAGIALGACGSSSLLSPDPDPEITISVVDGQIVPATEPIVFAVAGGHSAEPDRVTVRISSTDGVTVGETTIDGPQLNSDLSIDLASLAGRPGQYRARFVLLSGNTVLDDKSLVFFVGPGGMRMNGIESRPSLIFAGASVELSVELAAVEGLDPFLRWTQNGKSFAGGLASMGNARVTWPAPREPGVYTIGVELFPVAPVENLGFSFPSSVRTSTELYVSASRQSRSLGPPSSYWMLYDLDGSLKDSTRDAVEAEAVGTIEPAAAGDNLGYRLVPPSGVRIGRSIVPETEAALQGFTVSVDLTLSEVRPGARILASGKDQRLLSITLSADGAPMALLRSGKEETALRSGLAPLTAGDRHHVDLTFARADEGIVAMWFLDGEPGAVTVLGQDPPLPPAGAGETLIGGPGGITGIVDEFGVFYRDADRRPAPDPDVYFRAMALRHGDALLLADGFDGAYLSASYHVEGKAGVVLGKLVLSPGSSVDLALRKPASGEIVLETVADREMVVSWQGRTLRLTPGKSKGAEERIRVRIRPQAGEPAGLGDYRLALVNDGEGPLAVASLLAYVD